MTPNKKKKVKFERVGQDLLKELDDVKFERMIDIDKGKSRPISYERLMNGMVKYPEFKILKRKLRYEPREEDFK